jgi:ATP-dependent Clp protease ATP-binding subunit ClpC
LRGTRPPRSARRPIETEHLLLGILKEPVGLLGRILEGTSVSFETARRELDVKGTRVPVSVEIPFTKESKRALEGAAASADRLGHGYIGTEHLLLGLLGEEQTWASVFLARHAITTERVRNDIVRLLQ